MSLNTHSPQEVSFPTYKQFKEMRLNEMKSLKVILDEKTFRVMYFKNLRSNLDKLLQTDIEKAFTMFIKLTKKHKGFHEYLEEQTPYLPMLTMLDKNQIDKANKEYKRIYKASPTLQLLNAENLSDQIEYKKALDLASKLLIKFEYDTPVKAHIHLFIAEQKAMLGRNDVKADISAALDMYFHDYDQLDETDRLLLVIKLVSHRLNGLIGNAYQKLLLDKLCKSVDMFVFNVLYPNLLQPLFDFTPTETTWIPRVTRLKLDVCTYLVERDHSIETKRGALVLKAGLLSNLSRHEEAIQIYKELLQDSDDATLWYLLSSNQNHLGLYQEAMYSITKALTLDPDANHFQSLRKSILVTVYSYGSDDDKRELLENNFSNTALVSKVLSLELEEESAIRRNASHDYLQRIHAFIFESKPTQAIDLFRYVLDNVDIISDNEYERTIYLLHMIQISMILHTGDLNDLVHKCIVTFSTLDDQYLIDTLGSKLETYSIPSIMTHTLERDGQFKGFIDRIKRADTYFDSKFKALMNLDIVVARAFLEDYRELISILQYKKHDLKLSIREGNPVSEGDELDSLISQLPARDFELLIKDSYEHERYDVIISLSSIKPPESPLHTWYMFLACTYLGEAKNAQRVLESIDFDMLLNTKLVSDSDLSIRMSSVGLAPLPIMLNIESIFPERFPYSRIALADFLTILKKVSEPGLVELIDNAYKSVIEKIKKQPNELGINPAYGDEYNDLMVKKAILSEISVLLMIQEQKYAYASLRIFNRIQESVLDRYTEVIDFIKRDERNRILSNLSHSIKNLLRSVIDPLINLKTEFPDRAITIDNALKGASLIREMVNSINLSYKTSLDDLIWDIKHPGADSMTLQDMIAVSLQYSIGNMLDFRYFPAFAANYYRSLKQQDYDAVKEQWGMVTNQPTIEKLTSFADENMFKPSVNLTDTAQYHIGNEKSSAIKLLILFQEIIFNAVKYSSYVPRAERFIEIDLSEHDDKLKLQISNSFRPEVQAKTTGVGKLVIENFAKVLDCTPVITTDNNVYSITLEFNNIWKNNA